MPVNFPNLARGRQMLSVTMNRRIPVKIGNAAERHFKDSFRQQGFLDKAVVPWRRTKSGKQNIFGRKSSGIMIGTGSLMRSIRVEQANGRRVVVAAGNSKVKYAEIHNNGGVIVGNIPITGKMKRYFWSMFYLTGDPKWKNMALSKKSSFKPKIKMPRRQFMGESQVLSSKIESIALAELRQVESAMFGGMKR